MAQTETFRRMTRLPPEVRDKLDAVLVPNPSTGRTRLAWLQREATAITPSAILAEIGKLTVLRASARLEPRAVGVTAFTVDDALSILDEELFSGGPRPPVACVVEDVALGSARATRE